MLLVYLFSVLSPMPGVLRCVWVHALWKICFISHHCSSGLVIRDWLLPSCSVWVINNWEEVLWWNINSTPLLFFTQYALSQTENAYGIAMDSESRWMDPQMLQSVFAIVSRVCFQREGPLCYHAFCLYWSWSSDLEWFGRGREKEKKEYFASDVTNLKI